MPVEPRGPRPRASRPPGARARAPAHPGLAQGEACQEEERPAEGGGGGRTWSSCIICMLRMVERWGPLSRVAPPLLASVASPSPSSPPISRARAEEMGCVFRLCWRVLSLRFWVMKTI